MSDPEVWKVHAVAGSAQELQGCWNLVTSAGASKPWDLKRFSSLEAPSLQSSQWRQYQDQMIGPNSSWHVQRMDMSESLQLTGHRGLDRNPCGKWVVFMKVEVQKRIRSEGSDTYQGYINMYLILTANNVKTTPAWKHCSLSKRWRKIIVTIRAGHVTWLG